MDNLDSPLPSPISYRRSSSTPRPILPIQLDVALPEARLSASSLLEAVVNVGQSGTPVRPTSNSTPQTTQVSYPPQVPRASFDRPLEHDQNARNTNISFTPVNLTNIGNPISGNFNRPHPSNQPQLNDPPSGTRSISGSSTSGNGLRATGIASRPRPKSIARGPPSSYHSTTTSPSSSSLDMIDPSGESVESWQLVSNSSADESHGEGYKAVEALEKNVAKRRSALPGLQEQLAELEAKIQAAEARLALAAAQGSA
ncbi:hypothetical protein TREMEDRAFT_64410 [Tremella mesenterica DSM 1558]|uniref:uncharacterized protein n=1 Tax=Tremella mesenterica (strain ATCC 24925 / CBS 8224 / DSM 1558 / NBRC 9311 / NRRL Y-6157 / RJB 2259-6 / UBC 559-6) TaxID=578456 RepID=UPI0003F49F46|nr:uncharacterized protein TREMEDRAFT_64410 [Tremella mesenterica DSM 1558]EIW67170.1 hypothetical protein TREMEDRAFT_64410 [Tremella mesenterica DSM 1558]